MKRTWIIAALLVVVGGGVANADSIGGSSCGSCAGSVYTLLFEPLGDLDGNPSTEQYRIRFQVDTTSYTGGGSFIQQVAFKVSASDPGVTLVAAPGNDAAWSIQTGGINANGCSGAGSGFACATDAFEAPVALGFLEWVFDIVIPNGALFDGPFEASIKARYVDFGGNKKGPLLSENITLQPPGGPPPPPPEIIPEPSSLLLLGSGLAALSLASRRRSRRNRSE